MAEDEADDIVDTWLMIFTSDPNGTAAWESDGENTVCQRRDLHVLNLPFSRLHTFSEIPCFKTACISLR